MNFLKNLVTGVASAWQACLACFAAGLILGGVAVWRVDSWREGAHQTGQAQATVRLVTHDAHINSNLGTLYVPQFIFIKDETARREQEISQHVTPQIDAQYPLPLGFVRVRNDASHGTVPGPAAGRDEDPSGVPLSDLARADVADEGTLDLCRKMNAEWWDWYDQHEAAWNKTGNSVGAQ